MTYTIQKITLAYDEGEDRLGMALEDAEGRLLALWLTQRLAGRLVRALVARLNSCVEAAAPATELPDATRRVIQEWQQAAAMAQFEPSAPVPVPPGATAASAGVVQSVEISADGESTVLVFRWPADHAARLVLSADQLRQWLGIVHRDYERAEWPTDGVWPDWLAQPGQGAGQAAATHLLH